MINNIMIVGDSCRREKDSYNPYAVRVRALLGTLPYTPLFLDRVYTPYFVPNKDSKPYGVRVINADTVLATMVLNP